jgi:hypothetical protein
MLESTTPGNCDQIAIHVKTPELVPNIPTIGVFRCDMRSGKRLADGETFDPAAEVRACIESRILSFKLRGQSVGLIREDGGGCQRVIVVGGGSKTGGILQIVADVFDAPVFTVDEDGASLGAALRAVHGTLNASVRGCSSLSYHKVCKHLIPIQLARCPDGVAVCAYNEMIAGFDEFECNIICESEEKELAKQRRISEEQEKEARNKIGARRTQENDWDRDYYETAKSPEARRKMARMGVDEGKAGREGGGKSTVRPNGGKGVGVRGRTLVTVALVGGVVFLGAACVWLINGSRGDRVNVIKK